MIEKARIKYLGGEKERKGNRRFRHMNIITLVILNLRQIGDEIDLVRGQPLGPLQELPAGEQDREEADHGVRREEGGEAPLAGEKDGVAAGQGYEQAARQRVPRHPRLTPSLVGSESRARPWASHAAWTEGHDGEIDQLRRRHEADERVQHRRAPVPDLQEAQQAEEQDDENAVIGHPAARASSQHLRRFALLRQPEQTSTRAVHVAVSGAERGRQNRPVHNVRQDSDPKPVYRYYVQTRRRS